MIIRERENEFVMIEQDNHAQVSGEMMTNWKNALFKGTEFRKSVDYAIYQHDCGWKPFDKQPFWNDKEKTPYTFVDFPTPSKTLLYKNGVDEVEHVDSYAGLLCSEHYTRFLLNDESEEAQLFVRQEKKRQERIIKSFTEVDKSLFDFHYGLLQLCDNLSLFICLNEPGKHEHPFFKDEIPLSSALHGFVHNKIKLSWKDSSTIAINEFPFESIFDVSFKQKLVMKEAITANGLIESYKKAPYDEITIRFVPEVERVDYS